ncbi:hypothetical protein J4457_06565 [Candidatus Woesearchaeota archaeon]|nr:hypothetical protein [Candidatus Woesearchaeota archaeon]
MASRNQRADALVFIIAIIGAVITVYMSQPPGFIIIIGALVFGVFRKTFLSKKWI